MKYFQKLQVSIDFSSRFLINSLAPEPPINVDFQIILNYYPIFRENFEKIRQNFEKRSNFHLNYQNCRLPLIFELYFMKIARHEQL